MRTSMHISLPEPLKAWVEAQMRRSGYETASEYVRQLIREEQKRQLRETIDEKLLTALKSGSPVPGAAVLQRLRRKSQARRRRG